MAKSRPSLSSLFRTRGKGSSSIQLTSMSLYQNVDSDRSLESPKENKFSKTFTQIGNYRPKYVDMEFNNSDKENSKPATPSTQVTTIPEPAIPSTSGEPSSSYTPKYLKNENSIHRKSSDMNDVNSSNNSRANQAKVKKGTKTKSSKNYILMGDKDTPLVLESPETDSGQDGDDLPDHLPGDEPSTRHSGNYSTVIKEVPVSGEVDKEHFDSKETSEKAANIGGQDFSMQQGSKTLDINHNEGYKLPLNLDSKTSEKEMPYIPPADYDEIVMTMDIPEEESWRENHPTHQKPISAQRVYKDFQGDDFGKYLDEEDSEFRSPTDRTLRRYTKSAPRSKPQRSNKSTTNKNKGVTGTISKALFGSKAEVTKPSPTYTIHEFSFGHSKIGHGDPAGIPDGVWRTAPRSNRNRASHYHSNQQGNYELFLQARQGEQQNSSYETDEEIIRGYGGVLQTQLSDTSYSSPNKYVKRNGVWEKLTLRFRRRSRGDMGTVN